MFIFKNRKLKKCTYKNTEKFSLEGLTFRAKCVKVYDGDTITVVAFLMGKYQRFSVRMLKYDTPELGHRAKSLAEAAWAEVAKKTLSGLILDKIVTIKCSGFADGYGVRILGEIFRKKQNINEFMLNQKFSAPCEGKRSPWRFATMPDGKAALMPKKMLVILQSGNFAIMNECPRELKISLESPLEKNKEMTGDGPVLMPAGVPVVTSSGKPTLTANGIYTIPRNVVDKYKKKLKKYCFTD